MFHVEFCEIIAIGRNIVVFASWTTVGMIAFSRSISFNKKSFVDRHISFFVIGIWIYAVGLFLLFYADLKYVRITSDFHRSYLNAF